MQSEHKVRRSTRAQTIHSDQENASADERLVIDVPAKSPASDKMSKQQTTSTPVKAITPRKILPLARKVRRRPKSCSSNSTSDESSREETEGDDDDDEPNRLLPKLTRLKAKQLNKKPLPIIPLNTPRPDAEVAALIREELGSDDDDEEYKPTEEEIHSDDDPNTTVSDVDSQPRTPATPATPGTTEQEDTGNACYTKDGLFKIPRPRNDSQCSNLEQEQENIARRTRSKLCLQTTAIETIESTFVPPDITTDMYDLDCEMDHSWKEFLFNFTKPLPNHAEDDDDTDPEYVAAGKIPIDFEELREAPVSRKELNELVSEFIECGLNYDTYIEDDFSTVSNVVRTPSTNAFLETQNCHASQSADQEQTQSINQNQTVNLNETAMKCSYAPTDVIIVSSENSALNTNQQPVASVINTSIIQDATPYTGNCGFATNIVQTVAFENQSTVDLTKCHQGNAQATFPSWSKMDSGRFFVQEATIHESSFRPYYYQPNANAVSVNQLRNGQLKPADRRYRYVHTKIPVEVHITDDSIGYTDFQYQLFQQQLRMHIQLAAQNFLQSYAHPEFWNRAEQFKTMLLEFQKMFSNNPTAKPWNLDAAVECCVSWEADLEKQTEENKEMMKFLLEEKDKAEKNLQCTRHFHWKIMDKIVDSRAFLYPKLLPHTPFRMNFNRKFKIDWSEERLIALGLETFLPMVEREITKDKQHFRGKNRALMLASEHIAQYFCMPHDTERLLNCILARRKRVDSKSPIQYYFKHSKAAPFEHVLEKIDFNNVITLGQYQRNILPYIWDKHIYSNERISKLYPSSVVSTPKEKVRNSARSSTATTDANVNITINVSIDPQEQSAISVEKNLQTPQLSANQSFQSEKLPKTREYRESTKEITLASYVSEFREDSIVSIQNSTSNVKHFKSEPDLLEISNQSALLIQNPKQVSEEESCCKCSCHKKEKETKTDAKQPRSVQKRLTDYFRPAEKQSTVSNRKTRLKQKFWEILQRFRATDRFEFENSSVFLTQTYRHIRLISDFTYFLDDLKNMISNANVKKIDGEVRVEENVLTGTNRKPSKVIDGENQEATYAYNFFERVEETLLGENKHVQYEKFLHILQSFDGKDERVADLYYKIEELFLADHPELVDSFLTFLLPGQAAEVGKFFEHFILTNANDFLAKLNVYFAKQPSQIKKVYTCINELSQEPDVTMEQIKSRILPLLKGNPLLIEWFLQLFPPEKPIESGNLNDYEVISLKKLPPTDCTDAGQIYEDVPFVEVPTEPIGEGTVCGMKYIQGRILYGTLPARLSFLAHDCIPPTQPANEPSPIKGCVHNVRNMEKTKGSGTADGIDEKDPESEMRSDAAAKEDSPFKLCDKAAFKAHAIRLNPLVHGGKGVNFAEVAHLLVSDGDATFESDNLSEEEKSLSPKKPHFFTKSIVTKKRINSPVNKKPAAGKFSPPTGKKCSPILSSIPPDSKVVSISRKLKSLVDSPVAESVPAESETVSAISTGTVKRKPVSSLSPDAQSSAKREKLSKKCEAADGGESVPIGEKTVQIEEGKDTGSQSSWAREEDKVILEEIKNGFSTVEELLGRIEKKLESRSLSDIRSRYEFLMEVLKKFQKAN
ncbi:uncharacterized protein LOC128741221 [Sabethes cyaneus]|uniref:uncharacterized protein LOC128741221 n=1 Tax=Sabethes cyaneus TaxID=53552 RepID=UPI00237E54BE|nr:uncharacterized protein LOC128741221 [Sabethes cyaneus]